MGLSCFPYRKGLANLFAKKSTNGPMKNAADEHAEDAHQYSFDHVVFLEDIV